MKYIEKMITGIILGTIILAPMTHNVYAKTYSAEEIEHILSKTRNTVVSPSQQKTTIPADITISEFEQEVFELINYERTSNGLHELTLNPALSYIADMKSSDMKENYYFAHKSPTYGTAYNMINYFGLSYALVGENIAKGHMTPKEVVVAWMDSAPHRANILNPLYDQIGVGHQESRNYWTQIFTN